MLVEDHKTSEHRGGVNATARARLEPTELSWTEGFLRGSTLSLITPGRSTPTCLASTGRSCSCSEPGPSEGGGGFGFMGFGGATS